ncbi:MAG: hypothetical protein MR395_08800 [Caecibacter massiliensis]|jgi:sulfur relay (sulfurtransferase) complex TusBCD TusD component (DsrE family)|uniref:hypothetical protein n=1 Tax=unclassified Megasphaera TaxID=2626256 RepID=UPI0025BC229D|nr:hypothetical protein [Megasphaera sp. UBA4233]MCI5532687.1 hypothetical protein [Caecibacter massiliensis]
MELQNQNKEKITNAFEELTLFLIQDAMHSSVATINPDTLKEIRENVMIITAHL